MPSRNVIKMDAEHSYYHVYARGHGKHAIFKDTQDYQKFLSLFARHLSIHQQYDTSGRVYAHLSTEIELVAYCLMPNHFHLLLYQEEQGAMTQLMRSIMTSYSYYFNKKYDSSGALFESRYKASRISSDTYLMHISRYIHLNPEKWRRYPYSSISFYVDTASPEWLRPRHILELLPNSQNYMEFASDYKEYKDVLDEIKHELAAE